MALETHKYTTKPREVLAVRVTSQNMREVAAWCGGEISNNKPDGSRGPRHIKLEVAHARDERQKRAYPGDWVLQTDKGFRIFLDKAFHANFVQIDGVESVFHETGIPAKKASKKKRPQKKTERRQPPVNPVMAAAMAEARKKLGATEIESVQEVRIVDEETGIVVGVEEKRTVENSLDRLTGEPASVYTPPEDLVPIGTKLPPGGEIMNENQGERQDPAEVKKVDTATETTEQSPPAEPAPENPTVDAPVEVTPEAPTQG